VEPAFALNEAEESVAFVWCVPLECSASMECELSALLAPVEAARAARFATRDDRRRYVVSHAALRLILSAFTGRDSHAIHIATGARGMPYMKSSGPHFSLSRGGGVALVAVTTEGPIGVDVERVRPDLELDTFSRPLVPRADADRIDALAPEEQSRAWFQAWTRLEAAAKASGKGLSDDGVADLDAPPPFRIWNLDVDETRVGAVATVPSVAHVVYDAFPNVSSVLARFGPA
jgi:4'-phosphopantetheinyl transferase